MRYRHIVCGYVQRNAKVEFETIGRNFVFWKSEKVTPWLCWSLDNTITAKRWDTDELWFFMACYWGTRCQYSFSKHEDFTKSAEIRELTQYYSTRTYNRWSDPNGDNFVSRPLDADYTLDEISYKI